MNENANFLAAHPGRSVKLRCMNRTLRPIASMLLSLVIGGTASLARGTDQANTVGHSVGIAHWRTFVNRAGWSVRYPRTWRLQSCRQGDDLADPDAFLMMSDPASGTTVMIERLAEKPASETAEAWLHEIARDTVLVPIEREERIHVSGSEALKVINESSENIYVCRGSLTIAIRCDRTPQAVTRQIISTFGFTTR